MKKTVLIFLTIITLVITNAFAQTVTVCGGKYAKKYHNSSTCKGLNNCKGGVSLVTLNEAINMGRTVCLICKPATTQASTSQTVTPSTRVHQETTPKHEQNKSSGLSVQCAATTKKGSRCKRTTRSPNGYCWQHGGN